MKFKNPFNTKDVFSVVCVVAFFCLLVGLILLVYTTGYEKGVEVGKGSVITNPYKVYSDLRIEPLSETGLLGIVDGSYLEKVLKTDTLKPPFSDKK